MISGSTLRVVLCSSALLLSGATAPLLAQQTAAPERSHADSPRLVIGIMVDQMRYDYIYRYWDDYGEGGIRRLVNEGFSFDNARFDYMPTFTGPGHASVYTGTTPAVHGIIGNNWYVREEDRSTYVTEDPSVQTVGSTSDEGEMSPRWLLSSTITDELILHSNQRSRVVGVSIKDRGAILPAGHLGDAYWFDSSNAAMVSSTFYMEELPEWVARFNARDLPSEYLAQPWETLLPMEAYTASIEDDNPYEGLFPGQERPVFPHDLPSYAEEGGNAILPYTPFGDSYLFEFVRAAIEGEELGRDEFTDLVAVSFSAPDEIGHRYGPPSVEIQDTYLRFDRELEVFLNELDDEFGMENVLVFLTSDHGGAHNPHYLEDLNLPTGQFSQEAAAAALRERLEEIYGYDPVLHFSAPEVYLDWERIRSQGDRLSEVQQDAADLLLELEGVAGALPGQALQNTDFTEALRRNVQRGFSVQRSGDVAWWLHPQWFPTERTFGTTHGSPYSYDTRAPLIWYGFGVPAGRTTEAVYISDIASTLANFLNIPYTSGNTGNPMNHHITR